MKRVPKVLIALVALATLLVALWLGVVALLGRESVLQWAVARAAASVPGKLDITGLQGSLANGVRFERIVWSNDRQRISAGRGELRWRPDLSGPGLIVTLAHLDTLDIQTLAQSTEAMREPASLEIPLQLRIERLDIDVITVRGPDRAAPTTSTPTSTPTPIRFDHLSASARHDSQGWTLEQASVQTPWGKLDAQLNIGASAPFGVVGTVALNGAAAPFRYQIPVRVSGKLAALLLNSNFLLNEDNGTAALQLQPFEDQPLAEADVHLNGVSPRHWNPDWPIAELSLLARLKRRGNELDGTFELSNQNAGRIDESRIPLRGASAALNVRPADGRVDVTQLRIDLGPGGTLSGLGSLRDSIPALDLSVRDLDLHGLHGSLRKTRLAGQIGATRQNDLNRLQLSLAEAGKSLRVSALQNGTQVRIEQALLAVGAGRVAASGTLDLGAARSLSAKGRISHFNPRDLGNFTVPLSATDLTADVNADVNANISINGAMPGKDWRADVDLNITPSRFMQQALSGRARFQATPASVRDLQLNLRLGGTQLQAQGNLGGARDHVDWSLQAPRLADFGAGFAGRLTAHGSVAGTMDAPAVTLDADGAGLRLFDVHRIDALHASGRMQGGKQEQGTAMATLDNYRNADLTISTARLDLNGTRADHLLSVTSAGTNALRGAFNATIEARGGVDAQRRWNGRVMRLDAGGALVLHLVAPASLTLGADQFELGAAAVTLQQGRIDIERASWKQGELLTSGRASGVPLTLAASWSPALRAELDANVRSGLRLGAEWNLALGQNANGKLRVFREAGDIGFLTEPRLQIGLDRLEAGVTLVDGQLDASLDANGANLGRIHGQASSRLVRRGANWGLAGDAPLSLKAQAAIPSMRWLARLTRQPGLDIDGVLHAEVSGAGTINRPDLRGTVSGSNIVVDWPEQGVVYSGGSLNAEFVDDRLVLRAFSLKGGKGSFSADGSVGLAATRLDGQINFRLANFVALSRPDRYVEASGSGTLVIDQNRATLNANLRADRGLVDLAERSGPTISNDVVVHSAARDARRRNAATTAAGAPGLSTRLAVKLDLGSNFRVKGAGLDAKLIGVLQLVTADNGARAVGSIQIEEGTYTAYGQKLTIDRGVLNFSGPIDNPGLNILAMRKNQTVEAGVEVSGTALAPQAKLVSTPSVPDTEKLSWLLFGHGLEGTKGSDFALLSAAAAGLFGGGQSAGIQARLANALGVDEIGISSSGATTGSGTGTTGTTGTTGADSSTGQAGLLTVGKRISSRLFVSYQQGLNSITNLLSIRYAIVNHWSVQVHAGTENAVDVFYTLSFD